MKCMWYLKFLKIKFFVFRSFYNLLDKIKYFNKEVGNSCYMFEYRCVLDVGECLCFSRLYFFFIFFEIMWFRLNISLISYYLYNFE